MEVNVRRATAADYDRLCDLFAEIDALHRDHLPHLFQKPAGAALERDYFLALIDDEMIALFVAAVGEEVVGFAHSLLRVAPDLPLFVPRRYAVVDSIMVKSEFQHRGIGRTLMNSVQDWAIAEGVTAIELNVYEFNQTALSFYESLGYRTLSRKMSKEL
ncbi:MAG: GNAT family N-acetyltransferase [Caldilineales bacterium]|nr:GNAT family N-acetyltransferase [Caldilineales bacterium]MCW5858391.1 GNAT family N-acetyltransferase [Caldilineales bacterium]